MRPFIFSTDTTADITPEYAKEHNIDLHPLHYLVDDKEYGLELGELPIHEFYEVIRNGKLPVTNATNLNYDIELMERSVQEGNDIIHISFSSAMSSSYSNATLAAREVMERHPEARIEVFDSLSAIGGISSMLKAGEVMRENGSSFDEICDWIRETIPHLVVNFTVPDLFHLVRGGRLKRSSAILGTMMKIQPLLHISDTGSLEPCTKVRGRSAALRGLCHLIEDLKADGHTPDVIFISHGDCPEEAQYLAELIKNNTGISDVRIHTMSPTLGAHAGADVMAIGFIGTTR